MRKAGNEDNITSDFQSPHIDDLLSKLNNKLLASLSDLPEDVYDDSDEKNTITPTLISTCADE